MPHRRYKLQIYARGVTATTGSVSYTLLSSDFGAAPTAGGFRVDAAAARVESLPWQCRILDRGSTFTAKIADSSGRMHLLGRLTRLLSSIDSTASTDYGVMAVGRISDLNLAPDVTSYDMAISDERWVERQTQIFTKANTGMLIPSGLISGFHLSPPTPPADWIVQKVVGNLVCLTYRGDAPKPSAVQLIVEDVTPRAIGSTTITQGNFTHTRFRNTTTSTDYEIATFDSQLNERYQPVGPSFTFVQELIEGGSLGRLFVWLVWPTSQPTAGDVLHGYIYAPTHPPTGSFPLHIGGSSGITPFGLLQTLYTGTYSATTGLPIRYSTGRFNTLAADGSFGRFWGRITRSYLLSDFTDMFYGAYGVAPFTDSSGKIAPYPLRLPASTAITVASLPTLGSSNIEAGSHPTWEHPSGDIVNAVTLTYEDYGYDSGLVRRVAGPFELPLTDNADRIIVSDNLTVSSTYNTIATVGRRELSVRLPGTMSKAPALLGATTSPNIRTADEMVNHLAEQVFARFGDGPIYSDVQAMRSIDLSTRGRLLPGTFVKVALGTFPNPASLTRGSTRIMQIMERWDRPTGPQFRLLDVGPNLAVLSAPTVTLAQSTADTRHAIVGTVTGIPTGASWQAHLAITSTGSTAPAANSTRWFPTKGTRGSTSATFTRGLLPAESKIWGRVRSLKANRVGSAWSTNASIVTASITAPTITGITSITAGTATVTWTNGSSRYNTAIMIDTSTSATLGSSNRVGNVRMGTTRFDLVGLTSNTKHKVGVMHADSFGGVSPQDTTTFTTTTSYTKAPSLKGLTVLVGA